MRTATIEIYKYEELSDAAKKKAREWYSNSDSCDFNDFYAQDVIADVVTIAELFGLDLKQNRKTHKDKTVTYENSVFYSGFYSQGDGACFSGSYSYKKGGLKAVKSYAPNAEELHRIVLGFQELQKKHFYMLCATIEHTGHYFHEHSMRYAIAREDGMSISDTVEADLKELFRDFALWIYSNLQAQYEYCQSDKYIEESIIANEYEFTADGKIY